MLRFNLRTPMIVLALGPMALALCLLVGAIIGIYFATPVLFRAVKYDGHYAIFALCCGCALGLFAGGMFWMVLQSLRRCMTDSTAFPTTHQIAFMTGRTLAVIRESTAIPIAAIVASIILMGVACGYLAIEVAQAPARFTLGVRSIEPLPATQQGRKAMIADLVARGVFGHIEDKGAGPVTVWTGPTFDKLQTFEKQRYGRLVFDYYFDGHSLTDCVIIRDGQNHKEIGTVVKCEAQFHEPIGYPISPKSS